MNIGDYIDNHYNNVRLHSALGRAAFGYLSPMQFEAQTKE
jgi:transposase InsO family protein